MNKKMLKEALANLTKGTEITVTFRGEKANQSGKFTVIDSKVGKGKKGSRDGYLKAADGTDVKIRTRFNTEILNITMADGSFIGSATETNEEHNFSKDETRGNQFREIFKNLTEGQRVRMSSVIEPNFNGEFTVVSSSPSRGRYAQQKLILSNGTNNNLVVMSYKHSVAIEKFEVLNNNNTTNTTTTESV